MKKVLTILIFLGLSSIRLVAQKHLPNIQIDGIRLPDGFKIDQKFNNWPDTMQAFNRNNNIYYTLANNENELCLIVRCEDEVTIKKIFGGGITFQINSKDQRDCPAKVTISYPILDVPSCAKITHDLGNFNYKTGYPDSVCVKVNKDLTSGAKQLNIQGIAGVSDSIISIYNKQHIKVKIFLNSKMLTCKLSIPLKFILDNNITDKLYYNIMLNGIHSSIRTATPKHTKDVVTVMTIPKGFSNSSNQSFDYMRYPTDFWGEYKLK